MIEVKHSSSLQYAVSAPAGGFGNHVRWLALLDPCFQFELTPLAEPRFKKIPDPSRRINFLDDHSKLESFCTQIYPATRSWTNWLWMEWLYREDLDSVLAFDHAWGQIDGIDKNLVLTVDPDMALCGYFKLNSNLNHHTPEQFKQQVQQFNAKAQGDASLHVKKKTINVDCLYQSTLDREFYNSMIEWFELSDCYDLANQVHGLWFDAHQRAQQEFVEYVNRHYKRVG
jgi:hypothetical protein